MHLIFLNTLLAITAAFPTAKAAVAYQPRSDFVCPVEDIANTQCLGYKDCLYANPDNCTSFIQCTVNPDGSATPTVLPCASTLEWNDEKKECDYPPQECPAR